MTIQFTASSQSDSIKVHRGNLLRKIAQADSLPAFKIIAYERQRDIDSLNVQVANLKFEIDTLKRKEANTVKIFTLMGEQSTLKDEQLKIAMDAVAKLNRQLKWRDAKEKFMGGVGIAAIMFILLRK